MITNHIKITLRRLGRQKLTTSLHVVGLTLGIAVCLLIGLYLQHELSFDNYHAKADRTYRLTQTWVSAGKRDAHFSTPPPLAEALRNEVPELEAVAKVYPDFDALIEINAQRRLMQDNVLFAEPDFLDIFDVEMLDGNGHEALRKPNQVVLSRTAAERFFGRENAIGKTFKLKDKLTLTVAGLMEDLPENTHLPAAMLISFSSLTEEYYGSPLSQWTMTSGGSTFAVLPAGLDPTKIHDRLQGIYDRHVNIELPKGETCELALQPMHKVHFEEKYSGGGAWVKAVNPRWLWFFGGIALAVLALACINFVNLSTAQALNRAKEVGVRKTIGAGKRQLVWQFLQEAWMLAGFAGVLAYVVAKISLPGLNLILDKKISLDAFHSPALLTGLLGGVLLTGLLAGLYPAWVIARFRPVDSLKTSWKSGESSAVWLRKGLVVTQFTLSVGLLISLFLMKQQVNYFRSKNLGFDQENVVLAAVPDRQKLGQFDALLRQIPQVNEVAFSTTPPSNEGHWGTVMSHTDGDDPNRKQVAVIMADDHYCSLYGFELLAGRLIQPSDSSFVSKSVPDSLQIPKIVVNESLVKAMEYQSNEAALGQRFWFGFNGWHPEIVGVVKDFNTTSLHDAVKPLVLTYIPRTLETASIKLAAGADLPKTLAAVESAWKKTYPQGIYEFKFLDENIEGFYKSEQRLFTLFEIFSGLAMLISCLGLWGLATFAAQQRIKEIGVRKVLGASVQGIVAMLSKDFLLLVGISLAIASPLAYFGMKKWLQDFAFRIDIHWSVFALAGVVAVGVAFLTVSFQSIKAALANPVKSLRSE